MILRKVKNYALLLLSGLVGILGLATKLLGSRSKRLEIERDYLKARVERDRVIQERDNELEKQARSRRADAARDVDSGGDDTFRDPNRLWRDGDDS